MILSESGRWPAVSMFAASSQTKRSTLAEECEATVVLLEHLERVVGRLVAEARRKADREP